ncbi:alpha/beta fold hydrolase [Sinimarinibacterium thermocellulolyticum]|uniref:Alpha/beta hydrolase n=1 Tax=Sinimarinibacterium thermocellulolyticum TaxID=3170016 RepID=A0ABV2A7G7_9GAMM
MNWTIYLDSVRSYLEDDDWRTTLPSLAVPMTVLIGNDSIMHPAESQRMIRDLVPHARIVDIPDCGHAIPFEAPRVFRRELARFLACQRLLLFI